MSTIYDAHCAMVAQGYAPLDWDWWNGVYDPLINLVTRYCRRRHVHRSDWDEVISRTFDRMRYVHWDESDANVTITIYQQIRSALSSVYIERDRRLEREMSATSARPHTVDPTDSWLDSLYSEQILAQIPEPERTWLRSHMEGFSWTTIALEANVARTTLFHRVQRAVQAVPEVDNARARLQ
jgi:DNA-directed RNA polymerase specialized sigma24 family protein